MAGERDPKNPIDAMMPPRDGNPRYERLKAEHEERIQGSAEQGVLTDPAYAGMGDRMQRVRKNIPQATPPSPMPQTDMPPRAEPQNSPQATGLQVDPGQAEVPYAPVEHRLPKETVTEQPVASNSHSTASYTPTDSTNPILSKLREDFGIDKISLEEVKIGNMVFTMRILTTELVAMAMRFSENLSMSSGEQALNMQIACVAFSVQAIDGEPLWKIFDVKPDDSDMVTVEGESRPIFHPMKPPHGIRIQACTQLMEFLGAEASPALVDSLWEAYGEKVDPKGSLKSIVERVTSEGDGEPEDLPLP